MLFKTSNGRKTGFSILEFLFGLGVSGLAIAAVVGFSIFGSKSIAALYASCSLDQQNRKTIDQFTKDLRSVLNITTFGSNRVVCQDWDGSTITYAFNSTNQTLTRIAGTRTNIMLTDCTRLAFSYGMRLLSNGTFSVYPATNSYEIKTVTAEWCCARKVLGRTADDMPQYITVNVRTKQ
jgi:hypothetical protein